MDTQNIVIRREMENDRRAVENLVREAFWSITYSIDSETTPRLCRSWILSWKRTAH